MKKILKNLFEEKNIQINDEKLEKFAIFYDFLIKTNEKTNLTRIISKEDAAQKHFLDSLSSLSFIPQNSKLIDVGSGGGFPAIPLKIYRDDVQVTMVDSVQKKTDFLTQATQLLNLNSCNALHERIEDLAQAPNFREQFDVCTARAVAALNTLLEYCAPFVKIGGKIIAYKGSQAKIELENSANAIQTLGLELEKIFDYEIGQAKNCLLIFNKVRRTPNIYPRRGNLPRKKPL